MPKMGNVGEGDVVGAADAGEEDGIHLQRTWLTWDVVQRSIHLH
jgi:hypothetical protein